MMEGLPKIITQLSHHPQDLNSFLNALYCFTPIWDALTNAVFFVKNTQAEYLYANQTLLRRLNLSHLQSILGKTSETVFGSDWGKLYTEQDKEVLRLGVALRHKLELHNYASGELGWCITHKLPVYNQENHIIAMMGISIDIATDDANHPELNQKLAIIEHYIHTHFHQHIRMEHLSEITHLSITQIERSFKKIFHLTPSQYIQKVRMDKAIELLKKDHSITEIASLCGYADHSAFSRQFKQLTGITPTQFKQLTAS